MVFRFADVVLAFPDYDGIELEVKILLDTLHSELPSLSKEENDRLFYAVLEGADLPTKRERMKKMKEPLLQCVAGKICVCCYMS